MATARMARGVGRPSRHDPRVNAFAIVVCLGVGLAMLGLWTVLVARGQVPELDEGKPSIRFHIAAEVLTGVSLIAGAVGLWSGASWGPVVAAAALGAALYSCIASPGYYADRGERGPLLMFGALSLVVVAALITVLLA
jgi:hypothetical protein